MNSDPSPDESSPASGSSPNGSRPKLTLAGKILFVLFLLSLSVFFASSCSWVKNLDLPEQGVLVVRSGSTLELSLALDKRSIQGLYQMQELRARLQVDGDLNGRPLQVEDKGSSNWGDKPGVKPNGIALAATQGLGQVTVVTQLLIPSNPELIGSTVGIHYAMKLRMPQPTEQTDGGKAYADITTDEQKTIRVHIKPSYYTRLHVRVERGAFWAGILIVVAGLTRVFLKSDDEETAED